MGTVDAIRVGEDVVVFAVEGSFVVDLGVAVDLLVKVWFGIKEFEVDVLVGKEIVVAVLGCTGSVATAEPALSEIH